MGYRERKLKKIRDAKWRQNNRDNKRNDNTNNRSDNRDRPKRSFDRDEERKPFRDNRDRPRRSFDRDNERKPFRDNRDKPRRSFDRDDERKPFRDKDKKSFKEREPSKSFENKDKKKYSDGKKEFKTDKNIEKTLDKSERLNDENHGNLIIKKGKIYTLSKDKLQWYGEKVIKTDNGYLREFEAKRSKIGAAIKKGFRFNLQGKNILYLGSSSGTTVSHLSDLTDKNIIGVDIAPIVMREFVMLSELRKNVLPLLYDASKLSECNMLIGQKFEIIFEDIAQRNMVETFIDNFKIFAKKDGEGWLSLKTRSIDSTISPREVLDIARKKIEDSGLKIKKIYDLEPFEKEHYFIVVGF